MLLGIALQPALWKGIWGPHSPHWKLHFSKQRLVKILVSTYGHLVEGGYLEPGLKWRGLLKKVVFPDWLTGPCWACKCLRTAMVGIAILKVGGATAVLV